MGQYQVFAHSLIMLGIIVSCWAQPPMPSDNSTCASMRCGYNAMCQVVNGTAECVCPTMCIAVYDPVCGSDDKSYGNQCELQRESCRRQTSIQVVHKGVCETTRSDLCKRITCKFNGACFVNNGVAKCGCPVCGALYSPVCASDGKTYDNDCAVMTESCRQQKAITVVRDRACGSRSNTARIAIPTAFACLVAIGFIIVAVLMYHKVYKMRQRAAKIHRFTNFTNEEKKPEVPA